MYHLRWYRFNDVWTDIIEYVTHLTKNQTNYALRVHAFILWCTLLGWNWNVPKILNMGAKMLLYEFLPYVYALHIVKQYHTVLFPDYQHDCKCDIDSKSKKLILQITFKTQYCLVFALFCNRKYFQTHPQQNRCGLRTPHCSVSLLNESTFFQYNYIFKKNTNIIQLFLK